MGIDPGTVKYKYPAAGKISVNFFVDRTGRANLWSARRKRGCGARSFPSENAGIEAGRKRGKFFLDGKKSEVCRVSARNYFFCGRKKSER